MDISKSYVDFSVNDIPRQYSSNILDKIKDEIDINRRRSLKNTVKAPNVHIQKVFGPTFEFTEKYLVSDIDPMVIKDALKEMFKLDNLTRENLKYILREGAKSNNILRITDTCFENMVDTLNLPLDPEKDTNGIVSFIYPSSCN